ncbi:MAG TPA: citrate synthase [Acidobacteriota bacterium]|nr:citrate synthase [Acidobacteriota bacterium]|tara:strand:+ start:8163 stop:9458 length:1296 start_codon:yes stop_codon:yes gene_type:complete
MAKDTLTITDNRTGEIYEVPISYGTYPEYGAAIPASELRKIKASENDFGLITYDPGYTNTGSCKSNITFVDGQRGLLRYRGYPIDQLAEKSNYLEISYLLLNGERPNQEELNDWTENITMRTMLNESIKKVIDAFHYDAHPMGILVSTLGVLSTFYPKAKEIFDEESRTRQIWRLIAKMPTIAAYAYRHQRGLPYVLPDNDLSYTGNFLNMLFKVTEQKYDPDPILERALDVLFILHADHEQNCSTSVMRGVGSSQSDPYVAVAGAAAALYGPLHGGANEAVLRMLDHIGSVEKVPNFIEQVKSGEAGRLMGFGHRVYKSYDPRAKLIKEVAHQVFKVTGVNPLLEMAVELERVALEDDYFIERNLYPNVDFYSGIIYQAMGFPTAMFPVLFAIPRASGWLAQWQEMLLDGDQRIARPRQVYMGHDKRDVE